MKKAVITKKETGNQPVKKERAIPSFASRSSITALTVLGVIIVSGLGYYFLVKRQLDRVGPGREIDVATAAATLEQQQGYLAQLKSLKTNFEAIDPSSVDLLSQVLPAEKAVPELLAQLEVIARQTGVDLRSVNITDVEQTGPSARQRLRQEVGGAAPVVPGNVKEMLVQIEISAFTYRAYKDFISALESHTRVIDAQNFSFQTEQETQNITVKTYYLAT